MLLETRFGRSKFLKVEICVFLLKNGDQKTFWQHPVGKRPNSGASYDVCFDSNVPNVWGTCGELRNGLGVSLCNPPKCSRTKICAGVRCTPAECGIEVADELMVSENNEGNVSIETSFRFVKVALAG